MVQKPGTIYWDSSLCQPPEPQPTGGFSCCIRGFFCLLSGSIYLINDILDVGKDRIHPKKCKRSLASGKLKVSNAVFFCYSVFSSGLCGSLFH